MTAPGDCTHLEQTHAFADGELTGPDADAAREHLATCAICQAEFADLLQLDAAVGAVIATRKVAAVVPLAWYRRRRLHVAGVALAAAAGVAIYLALPRAGAPDAPPRVAVALAPHRSIEARLAWSGASGYRPYDVPRAEQPPHESVAVRALADLEARGDVHGVGALALLNGERRRAADYLARAGGSADALADRAALALADQRPERALAAADAALAAEASHGPALWNRALALRDLSLPRAAAAAFRELARRDEPGWAGEARERAAALDGETAATEQRFERIRRAGAALAHGELQLSLDDARAMPGLARAVLHDAMRAATTPAELAALQPLAAAIDAVDRDTAARDALIRAAELHPALARRYRELVRSVAVARHVVPAAADDPPIPSGAARHQLLAELRAAHADEPWIGALVKLSDDPRVIDRGELAELARITAASRDPWIQLLGLQQQAEVALAAHDAAGAESILLRAQERCTAADAPARRCAIVALRLGELALASHRTPVARAALSDAWKRALAASEWDVQGAVIAALAELAAQSDDASTGPSLARAYAAERGLRPGHPVLAE